MRRLLAVGIVTFLSLCDLIVTSLLFSHLNQFTNQLRYGVYQYQFGESWFDLWILCIFRVCAVLGLIVAVLLNSLDAVIRVRESQSVVMCFSALMVMFSIVKLLVVSEDLERLRDFWCWGMLAWSMVMGAIFIVEWCIVGHVKTPTPQPLIVRINNADDTETKHLLGEERGRRCKSDRKSDQDDDTDTKKPTPGTILRLLSYSKPDLPWLITAFIFLTISATGEIFIPFYTGKVVDGIVIDKSKAEFTSAIITMAIISLGSAFAAGVRGGCFSIAIQRLNIRIRNLLFFSVLKQEIGFFDQVKTGDITSRMTSDTTTMSDTVGLNVNIFLRSFIKAVGVIFFMFKLSWQLSMVTLIGLPCVLFVSKVYGKYYKRLAEQVQDSLAEANSVAEEACSTIRTVRSFANEEGEETRYRTALEATYKLYKKEAIMYSGYLWSTRTFELALTVAVLYYGGHLVVTGKLSGGTLVSFILYQIQLGDCVDSMGSVYTGLMQAAGASQKVFEYIDRRPKILNMGKLAPLCLQGRVEFRNVTFSYPSRPETQVLKNVSFHIQPGEIVALVGPSGSGKTSCVNLLQHLYQCQSGQVLLDSVPLYEYDHEYLHRKVSLVDQEPVLYARTVQENITYGLTKWAWSDDTVMEAARQANAHQFIMEMRDGYNTQTGEKGVQMSGGQKQRIAIARALLRKPVVLLLDEATSALDSESEHAVQESLYRNLLGKTVIIIAHRLSTVERADRIIVIDKGEIVQQGTHQQLLKQRGLYTSLVRHQLLTSGGKAVSEQRLAGENSQICMCTRRKISSGGTVHRQFGTGSQLSSDSSMDKPSPKVTFIVGSA